LRRNSDARDIQAENQMLTFHDSHKRLQSSKEGEYSPIVERMGQDVENF
jgi:hypothetical protein